MRRSPQQAGKQPNSKKEAEKEPEANKISSDDKIHNIATLDNGTMVESFKFLNYYQLATSSLVTKRFRDLIRTHRHKLALLQVYVSMNSHAGYHNPDIIKMFNEELTTEKYNEWIVRNGYSKHATPEDEVAGEENTENKRVIYSLRADAFQDPYHYNGMTVLHACTVLKNDTWPIFDYFLRLVTDPFIHIRTLEFSLEKDGLCLLTGTMNPDHNRLQCQRLNIRFDDDTRKFIAWTKNHVRSDSIEIDIEIGSNYDEELLNFFVTGALCTSAVEVKNDFSKVIEDFVQVFMNLKNSDEFQMVESFRGNIENGELEDLKCKLAKFGAVEEQYEDGPGITQGIGFINNDIQKKLTLRNLRSVKNFGFRFICVSIEISDW